jgi:NAD(P)-dependent dehydrogenase (short-subunit alcohol dehydrogenase family)
MNDAPEVVVITGASTGVGARRCENFAKHGARIGLIARGVDGLKAAQKEVEELGGKALVFPVDIGNADRVEAAAAQIEADLGEIDIWINNAMASVFSPVKEMTPEEFRRVTEVTFLGCVYGDELRLFSFYKADVAAPFQARDLYF